MKYGLIPQSSQEKGALNRSPNARVLLDPFIPMVFARTLISFVRLGLPEAMAAGPKSAAKLASELGLSKSGLNHLLRVLTASGYVCVVPSRPHTAQTAKNDEEQEERYELTALSRNTLLEKSPAQLDAWVGHNMIHWKAFSSLEEIITSTGPRDIHHSLKDEREWETYQRAMMQTARPAAQMVAELIPEPEGNELLLDLGGSHGLYGAAICRRYPPMRSRVVDLPEAIEHARCAGESEGLAEIVEYVEGDMEKFEFGEKSCDVVFMGNVIHHFDDERLAGLLHRIYQGIRPGGVLAIWDMAPPLNHVEPDLIAEAFSLLFYLTSESECRGPDTLERALADAGFSNIEIHGDISPTHTLITVRRN